MIYNQKVKDLFTVESKYYLAHCVSADYALGAGIATQFVKYFNMRKKLEAIGANKFPDCILIDRVFNLATKEKSRHKPTYDSLIASLILMREEITKKNIKYLAMPKIGCGIDGLSWGIVQEIIRRIFDSTDVEILICVIN